MTMGLGTDCPQKVETLAKQINIVPADRNIFGIIKEEKKTLIRAIKIYCIMMKAMRQLEHI